jgi:hypothetical protein
LLHSIDRANIVPYETSTYLRHYYYDIQDSSQKNTSRTLEPEVLRKTEINKLKISRNNLEKIFHRRAENIDERMRLRKRSRIFKNLQKGVICSHDELVERKKEDSDKFEIEPKTINKIVKTHGN